MFFIEIKIRIPGVPLNTGITVFGKVINLTWQAAGIWTHKD